MVDEEKVREKVEDKLEDSALRKLTEEEIREAIEEAGKGATSFDIFQAMKNSEAFCEQCGECCRRNDPIILSEEDSIRLGNILSPDLFTHYVEHKEGKWRFKKTKPCAFLKENGKCSIYEYRPHVCRQFPLVEAEDGEVTLGEYEYCSFVENLTVYKATSLLIMKLMKKKDPQLAENLKDWMGDIDSLLEKMEGDQDQEAQIRLAKKISKKLEDL